MKRFLPLFILTGLLFGQDVLHLKSGKLKKGVFVEKLDNDIVFQVEGENDSTNFPINDVDIIVTQYYGELYYPFDVPSEKEIYKQERQAPDDIMNRLSDRLNRLADIAAATISIILILMFLLYPW